MGGGVNLGLFDLRVEIEKTWVESVKDMFSLNLFKCE